MKKYKKIIKKKVFYFYEEALYIPDKNVLVINDLHLGAGDVGDLDYDPLTMYKGILRKFIRIVQAIKRDFEQETIAMLVINGDYTDGFSQQKLGANFKKRFQRKAQQLCDKVVLVNGNHDPQASKRDFFIYEDYFFTHGHLYFEAVEPQFIILGHQHPSLMLEDQTGIFVEKCYLVAEAQEHAIIIVPSFFPVETGQPLNTSYYFTPYLQTVEEFSCVLLRNGQSVACRIEKDAL